MFLTRIPQGRVRDGHGDLRLEHVYLAPKRPPTIIDCVEFNERFRYADVCTDNAFLSMDLERLGRADLAERLLAAYARASGDYDLYALVNFYEGYRACVRGKVASILSVDTGASVLSSGRPVVLDASFRSRALRRRAQTIARERGIPFYFVECTASPDECRRRLRERARLESVSDGHLEVFDAFVARWETVDELPAQKRLVVDTCLPLETNIARLRDVLPIWPQGFTK